MNWHKYTFKPVLKPMHVWIEIILWIKTRCYLKNLLWFIRISHPLKIKVICRDREIGFWLSSGLPLFTGLTVLIKNLIGAELFFYFLNCLKMSPRFDQAHAKLKFLFSSFYSFLQHTIFLLVQKTGIFDILCVWWDNEHWNN